MALNLNFTVTIRDQQAEVVGWYSPGDPGKLYGPPEDCYPPEPADFEADSIVLEDGTIVAFDDLTESEQEDVRCAADEAYGEYAQADDERYEPEPDFYEPPGWFFDNEQPEAR